MAKMTKYAQPIQRFGSRQLVVSRLPLERYCGAITTAIAESKRAKRRPPNSRAMRAVCTTSSEDASAGMKRMARRESPSAARETWLRNGISGGDGPDEGHVRGNPRVLFEWNGVRNVGR